METLCNVLYCWNFFQTVMKNISSMFPLSNCILHMKVYIFFATSRHDLMFLTLLFNILKLTCLCFFERSCKVFVNHVGRRCRQLCCWNRYWNFDSVVMKNISHLPLYEKIWGDREIEPRASCTLSKNHTPRSITLNE